MSAGLPRTARGLATKSKLIEAAERVFSRVGYADASISRITDAAGIGQGTFYLYFDSKLQIFNELVEDLNHRVRLAMSEASAATDNRIDSERAGFRAFFQFTADHPALYRVIREAEFVSPGALRLHYTRIVEGYIAGLRAAGAAGQISDIDPTVAAWALMGVGEMIGMRWVLWGDEIGGDEVAGNAVAGADSDPFASGTRAVPEHVFEQMMRFIEGALGATSHVETRKP